MGRSGRAPGSERIEFAVAQSRQSFGGSDLYPDLEAKVALCFSLTLNHPFVDGNSAWLMPAMEVFLLLNGYEFYASSDEQEQVMLHLAAGSLGREELLNWIKRHMIRSS